MNNTVKRTAGRNLRVGDVIRVWWTGGGSFNGETSIDTITELKKYTGSLAHGSGGENMSKARIASFSYFKGGMTIVPQQNYDVVGNVRPKIAGKRRKKFTAVEKDMLLAKIIGAIELPCDYRSMADAIRKVLMKY